MSKKHRKFLATSVTAAIVASAVAPIGAAAATEFSDLKEGDFGYEEVMGLVDLELIKGYPDGTFKPNAEIDRAHVAVLLQRAWGLELPSDAETAAILKENYTDVTPATQYAKEIAAVTEAGLMQGNTTTNTFSPLKVLTREQMATVLVRAYGLENTGEETNLTDVKTASADHQENIEILTQHGIAVNNDGTFNPKGHTKRVHFAVYLYRAEAPAQSMDSGVSGFVTLAGVPTEGVKVSVDGHETLTNAAGYYKLNGVKAGEHKVTISKTGYATKTVDVEVFQDAQSAVIENLSTVTQANIAIQTTVVETETGAPAVGAEATLEKWNQTTKAWEVVTVTEVTDANGLLTIANADVSNVLNFGDKLRLKLTKDYQDYTTNNAYFASPWVEFTLKTDAELNVLNGIELNDVESSTISGTVKGTDGAAVGAGINVDLLDQDGETVLDTVATAADGSYEFVDYELPSGKYFVKVATAGTEAVYVAPIQVTEGTDLTHNVSLIQGYDANYSFAATGVGEVLVNGSTYTAKIKQNGAVVSEVPISALANDLDTVSFVANKIPVGNYTVEISGDFIIPAEFPITVTTSGATDSNRVTLAGVVSGTVTEVDGSTPITEAKVELVNANGTVVKTTTSSATDGTYKFGSVPAGDYTVKFEKSGFVSETSVKVSAAKNTTQTVNASLDAVVTTADVSGFVRTSGTLAPSTGATVSYYAISVQGSDPGDLVGTVSTVSATGAYSFSDLVPGAYQVVVRDAGNHETSVSTITVAAGDEITNKNYVLTSGGDSTLEVSFVDEDGNEVDLTADSIGFTSSSLIDEHADTTVADEGIVSGAITDVLTFTDLSSGNYTLDLDITGYQDFEIPVNVLKSSEGQLELTLVEDAPAHTINARVIDENNADVTTAKVVVLDGKGTIVSTLTHTSAGNYSAQLLDGDYTIAVYLNGYLVPSGEFTVDGENVTIPAVQLLEKYTN